MVLELEAIEELPPELTGALTFHLPLEVAALELAGAPAGVVADRIARRLPEAYAAGLVDPPLYRWAVDHYRPPAMALLDADPVVRAAAFARVEPLGDGLAGAAFHGLIRLGYGLWRRRPGEVARGLAYLRTRRQVLVAGQGAHAPGGGEVGVMPSAATMEGATVFDMMNLAAGAGATALALDGPGGGGAAPAGVAPTPGSLAAAAAALARRNPSSFVAVHTVTGLHGLCELHRSAVGDLGAGTAVDETPAQRWWRAYGVALGAARLVVGGSPPEELPEPHAAHDTVDRLLAAAVASGETHDVKLVLALRRLAQLGLLDEATVLKVGATKLAATECATP